MKNPKRFYLLKKIKALSISLLVFLVLPLPLRASGNQADGFPRTGKQWTLAFYLNGDNSLEREQAENLREIVKGAAMFPDAHVVVFFDRDETYSYDTPFTSWKGSRLFHVGTDTPFSHRKPLEPVLPVSIDEERFETRILGRIPPENDRRFVHESYLLQKGRYWLKSIDGSSAHRLRTIMTTQAGYLLPFEEYPVDLDATDGQTLYRFVQFVKDNFISKHYALFMAGHGSGWYEGGLALAGQAEAGAQEACFRIRRIQEALELSPVDVLAMDTCLMADIETVWSLRDTAAFFVANQLDLPSRGLDYSLLLRRLGQGKRPTPGMLARETVRAYGDAYRKRGYPMSVVAMRMGSTASLFIESFQKYASGLANRPDLASVAGTLDAVPTASRLRGALVDLVELCERIGDRRLNRLLTGSKGLIMERFQQNTGTKGVSIYLPQTRQVFDCTYGEYGNTRFSKDFPEAWVRFAAEFPR